MLIVKRGVCYLLLMACVNAVLLFHLIPGTLAAVAAGIFLAVFSLRFHIAVLGDKAPTARLRIQNGGHELVLAATVCFTLEAVVYLWLLLGGWALPGYLLAANAVAGVLQLLALLLNGALRILFCSRQVGVAPKLSLLLLWWVPVVNIVLLRKMLRTSRREYAVTLDRHKRNRDREEEQLCATRYPLLMVHGIFFRDWEIFNYWGRVPGELAANGAQIHYGNHQSSASVEQCGEELRRCILELVQATGCGKVNIIAHSKGGLDARYAISCLGMGEHVASLTTVNTPHLGCPYVGKLLDKISDKAIAAIGKGYESLFTLLGDNSPDFLSGLKNLTAQECAHLNSLMPDHPGVLYQSVGSIMKSRSSAMFPLNVGYSTIKFFGGGDNDGLVSAQSMEWGDYLGTLTPKGRKGISHGDVIDLTRKDVPGYDVCEFYVDLVSKLKEKGL